MSASITLRPRCSMHARAARAAARRAAASRRRWTAGQQAIQRRPSLRSWRGLRGDGDAERVDQQQLGRARTGSARVAGQRRRSRRRGLQPAAADRRLSSKRCSASRSTATTPGTRLHGGDHLGRRDGLAERAAAERERRPAAPPGPQPATSSQRYAAVDAATLARDVEVQRAGRCRSARASTGPWPPRSLPRGCAQRR